MPRIISNGTYNVYVYQGDHAPPHCHVIWAGDTEAVVDLKTLNVTRGQALPRAGRDFVQANRAKLLVAWNRMNPKRIDHEENESPMDDE